MDGRPFNSDLLTRLRKHERMLLRRYGMRLRVDKVTSDGKSALCSIAQVRRRWFRSARSTQELIEVAHAALMPLHRVGLSPLISCLPRQPKAAFPVVDKNHPFGIQHILLHTEWTYRIRRPFRAPLLLDTIGGNPDVNGPHRDAMGAVHCCAVVRAVQEWITRPASVVHRPRCGRNSLSDWS